MEGTASAKNLQWEPVRHIERNRKKPRVGEAQRSGMGLNSFGRAAVTKNHTQPGCLKR